MTGQRVGVVGEGSQAADLAADLADVGVDVVDDPTAATAGVDLLVAVGEDSLLELVRAGVDCPVVPVESGAAVCSVAVGDATAAVERALADGGELATRRHPVVAPRGAAADEHALFDLALMAGEPASISEFAVHAHGRRVARFRADGVVASTPAGSVGYNHTADGPIVAPGSGVLSVVPIAPFATDVHHWVLPIEEVSLSVVREGTPVELLVDGRAERTVDAHDPVSIGTAGSLEVVIDPAGTPPY